jgi:competence protein ComFB
MTIHNILEDIVVQMVKSIFDDEKMTKKKGFCTCQQCEMDVACYVLNQMQPKYIISGRGLAYYEKSYSDKIQMEADLAALIHSGIKQVSRAKRPHFDHMNGIDTIPKKKGIYFNLPVITGRLFNSVNFEPVNKIEVGLYINHQLVEMINPNWQNPNTIVEKTAGTYNFWPKPIPCKSLGEKRKFEFEILVEDSCFEPLKYYFSLNIESMDHYMDFYSVNHSHTIKDLYLIPA